MIVAQREWGDFGLTEDELLDRFRAIGSPDAGDAIRAFFEAYAERVGKPRWGDKTPRYVTRMRLIADALPEAHFVHVIRDGRDVALSVRDRTVKDYTVERVAQRWKEKVSKARRDAPLLKHYVELRYEDLVLDPEGSLRKISEFVDLPYDDAMLRYHEQAERRLQEMARELPEQGGKTRLSVERRMATHARTTEPPDPERVTRWRNEMSADDQAAFEGVAGALLVELGYEVGGRDGGGASPETGSPSGLGELANPAPSEPGSAARAACTGDQSAPGKLPPRRLGRSGPCAVHGRGDALGNDAASVDARRAPRDGDSVGNPLHPRPDQGLPARERHARSGCARW